MLVQCKFLAIPSLAPNYLSICAPLCSIAEEWFLYFRSFIVLITKIVKSFSELVLKMFIVQNDCSKLLMSNRMVLSCYFASCHSSTLFCWERRTPMGSKLNKNWVQVWIPLYFLADSIKWPPRFWYLRLTITFMTIVRQVPLHVIIFMYTYTYIYSKVERIAKRTVFWLLFTC